LRHAAQFQSLKNLITLSIHAKLYSLPSRIPTENETRAFTFVCLSPLACSGLALPFYVWPQLRELLEIKIFGALAFLFFVFLTLILTFSWLGLSKNKTFLLIPKIKWKNWAPNPLLFLAYFQSLSRAVCSLNHKNTG
jgi:hypothetical protein